MKTHEKNAEKVVEKVWKLCPKCNNDLIYRFSKTWKFIWCSWYPECDYIEQNKDEVDMLESLRKKVWMTSLSRLSRMNNSCKNLKILTFFS